MEEPQVGQNFEGEYVNCLGEWIQAWEKVFSFFSVGIGLLRCEEGETHVVRPFLLAKTVLRQCAFSFEDVVVLGVAFEPAVAVLLMNKTLDSNLDMLCT